MGEGLETAVKPPVFCGLRWAGEWLDTAVSWPCQVSYYRHGLAGVFANHDGVMQAKIVNLQNLGWAFQGNLAAVAMQTAVNPAAQTGPIVIRWPEYISAVWTENQFHGAL
jgi:hypothetical protein